MLRGRWEEIGPSGVAISGCGLYANAIVTAQEEEADAARAELLEQLQMRGLWESCKSPV